jgi:putative glycosyltransferase (TIGR04372 family)
MNIENIKDFFKNKIKGHKENQIYLRATIHLIKFFLYKEYRDNRCLIDPSASFFYKYRKLSNYFAIPLSIFAKYLKKKNIFISVHNDCNFSMGHIYSEIDQIQRMQKIDNRYYDSIIWFTTSRKEILGETSDIFENKSFKIIFGGVKRIFLTLVAMRHPSISIDASLSIDNYIMGNTKLSQRVVFHDKPKKRGSLIARTSEFYPNKDKLSNYHFAKNQLLQNLKIYKKYIVIQVKTTKQNGTIKSLSPDLLLETIKYFQNKDYQIILAGREEFPEIFLNKSIIDYANSRYASPLNDFLLIGQCSLVISAASGFCNLPENFDKPLLILNGHHLFQYFGRRTIHLPTLLSRRNEKFNAITQFKYLCDYGPDCGYDTFDDLHILHMPTSYEIFMAAKELEAFLSTSTPSHTSLQKKIRDGDGCPLLSYGLSRISNYYLTKHGYFFIKNSISFNSL